MERLKALAAARNLALVSKEKLLNELGQSIARRIVKRSGAQVYQMLTCALPYFPRQVLQETFPEQCVTEETAARMTWELRTVSEVAQAVGPLMQRSTYVCVGSTKAFKTKSERVIRVVAKLMPPFEICHEDSRRGVERLYLNGMYVLATQEGELHFPKDNYRREMRVENEVVRDVRLGIEEDMRQLGREGNPLSPSWWRRLGNEEKAKEVEQWMANPSGIGKSERRRRSSHPRNRRASMETFEIESIVAEKKGKGKAKVYLVRWANYDESWEPWRITGQPGDPIDTWEPAHLLKGTVALQEWRETRGEIHSN